jgi:riboflavin kinase/FMN adenylyltransferase
LLAAEHVDAVLMLYFTHSMAAMSPEHFFHTVLMKHLQPSAIVVGANFQFGNARTGTAQQMQTWAHCPVHLVKDVRSGAQGIISSTRIRQALIAGNITDVTRCLGRPYSITSTVIHGKHLARKHGIPTINLHIPQGKLLPHGVFAGHVHVGTTRYAAVINVGTRPTIDQSHVLSLEAHMLGFRRMIYGKTVTVSFDHFLRTERAFDSLDALFAQIHKDIIRTQRLSTGLSRGVIKPVVQQRITTKGAAV